MAVTEPRFPHRRARVAVGLTVALAFLVLAFPSVAFGWDAVKSSNGVVLCRESEDSTASSAIAIYYNYKGGNEWNAAYPTYSSASYNNFVQYTGFLNSAVDVIEVPLLADGGRFQLVGGSGLSCPVIYEPLRVSVVGTATVAGQVTLPDDLPVTLDTTLPVSLDSTLPVSVASIGAFDFDGVTLALVALLACAGVFVWRRMS